MERNDQQFVLDIEQRLGDLQSRARALLAAAEEHQDGDTELARAATVVSETLQVAASKADGMRLADTDITQEWRNGVSTACAQQRIELAALDALLRARGVASGP